MHCRNKLLRFICKGIKLDKKAKFDAICFSDGLLSSGGLLTNLMSAIKHCNGCLISHLRMTLRETDAQEM